jgi:Helix-turn-helix domain
VTQIFQVAFRSECSKAISLASFADRDGMCWPSMETLADISNIDKRTAVRAIQRLTARFSPMEPRTLLSIVKNTKVKVRTSTYQLNLELLKELKGKRLEGDTTPSIERKNGETMPPFGCNVVPTSDIASGDITPPEQGGANSDIEPSKRTVSVNLSASAYAKERASYISGIVNEDLGELAIQIALRHPRSRISSWTRNNVGLVHKTSIIDAMADEAQRIRITMAEAGRMMLLTLDAWDDIPRDKWEFAAAIPKFYKQADYRVPPNELPGIAPREGARYGTEKRDTSNISAAFRMFLEPASIAEDGDSGIVDHVVGDVRAEADTGDGDGVHGFARFLDAAPASPGIQPRDGQVQVLAKPSYPPQIQWPRRNG